MKNFLSIVLALVLGYVVIKILWWMLGIAFAIAITVVQIVFLAAIAIPLYIIIRHKLLR